MKILSKKNIVLLLLLLLFSLICLFFLQNKLVFLDGQSVFYPAQKLLTDNSLNLRDNFNNLYDTHYFKFIFGDTVFNISGNNEIFPTQQISVILFYSIFIAFFGLKSFFYFNAFLGIFIILISYLVLKEIYKKERLQIIGLLLIAFSPLLMLYGTQPQTIIPAIFFLIASLYSIIKYNKTGISLFRILGIGFFMISCYIRIPMVLFGILFLPYLLDKGKFKFHLLSGIIACIIFISPFLLLNIKYFGSGTFIGYLHINDRPLMDEYGIISKPMYISGYSNILVSLNSFLIIILKFFKGSLVIFSPTILFSILVIFLKKEKQTSNIYVYILLAFIINLLYYTNIDSQLRYDKRPEFSLTLTLVFFRYMFPAYLLMVFLVPFFFMKTSKTYLIFYIFYIVSILPTLPINYKGGANLQYFKEIEEKRFNYANTLRSLGTIKPGSTILFDERNTQYYLYPNVNDYHRFCYYCIPPGIRFQHTHEVIKKMLLNNESIYFASFGSPYNEKSQDMEDFLDKTFILQYVTGSNFDRESFRFLKVLDEK